MTVSEFCACADEVQPTTTTTTELRLRAIAREPCCLGLIEAERLIQEVCAANGIEAWAHDGIIGIEDGTRGSPSGVT